MIVTKSAGYMSNDANDIDFDDITTNYHDTTTTSDNTNTTSDDDHQDTTATTNPSTAIFTITRARPAIAGSRPHHRAHSCNSQPPTSLNSD